MKHLLLKLIFAFSLFGYTALAQTTLISPTVNNGGFESGAAGWTFVNGTQTNQWFIGTTSFCAGTQGAFIGSSSLTNRYDTAATSTVFLYKDITFPAGQTNINLSFSFKGQGEANKDYMRVFLVPTTTLPVAGTALTTGQVGADYLLSTGCTTFNIPLAGTNAGTTQRLVFAWTNDRKNGVQPAATIDDVTITTQSATCNLGTGVYNVTLPFTSAANLTTCGQVNDITSANAVTCGSTLYFGGEDVVYVFTPTTSGISTIALTSSGTWTGLMLYNGCPIVGAGSGTCVASSQSSTGSKAFCVTLTAGVTYYLVIDVFPSPSCNPYSLSISAPSSSSQGTTCANPLPIPSLPYSATGQTTACFVNDYTNASTGSCGSLYESGEDKVYSLTVNGPQCIRVALSNSSTTYIGFQVYSGCPGTASASCIANFGGATNGSLNGIVTLPAAGTYFIIVDTWAAPDNCTYSININSYGTGPVNDLPCNAVPLTVGVAEPGDNSCSSGLNDPSRPTCFDATGNLNTVWYKFTATSTSTRIKTIAGTLDRTQIAVFTGASCSALSIVTSACNDNAGSCGSQINYVSELLISTTIGTTYYIMVDGEGGFTGSFSVLFLDGTTPIPPIDGMDCVTPNPVCAAFFQVSDPGYSGFGNTCDLPSSYCLASAERSIVWYTIPINAAGNLVFDLVPNDFNISLLDETDYDFAIWRIGGTGAVNCSQIAAGTAPPLECNYSFLGITGLNGAVDLTAPTSLSASVCPTCGTYNPNPTYNGAYQSQIPVAAGDVLLLAVSNFSNSTSGFRIDFKNSPIGYVGNTATSVTWTGGTNSVSTLNSNWGGCSSPSCGVDGIVASFINQPVIAANQSFKDLEIQSGATVTINAGVTVTICGNLINNGNLRCDPTSTILFTNPITHSMIGSFTGLNALGNLTINASGAGMQVNLMNDLDLKGTFTTSNTNSIFNANSNNIKVAKDFVNNNGNSTFLNVGTGFLEFNGAAAQIYNQGTSQLDLNIVTMNHTGPGVTLQTNMCMKSVGGQLNLTLGKIITNTFEVRQYNRTATSVTIGNASSFVQGFLRRWINSTGSYDFPLGDAAKGYERANFNFSSSGNIDNLLGKFFPFSALPAPSNLLDCSGANLYNFPYLNHGYWQVNAYDATLTKIPGTGSSYRTTLYNLGYTNSAGAICWTVMKDASLTGSWAFDGVCNAASTAAITIRDGMSGFSNFATGQGGNPLPIELIRFDGFNDGDRNVLQWSTATETNNDYFTLKRSADGLQFESIARLAGAGNSTSIRNYEYVDNSPLFGISYYMLLQTDYDGASSNSETIAIKVKQKDFSIVSVRPNPNDGQLFLDFYSDRSGVGYIKVSDLTGRVVKNQLINLQSELNTFSISLMELAKGIYSIAVVTSDNQRVSSPKMIVRQ